MPNTESILESALENLKKVEQFDSSTYFLENKRIISDRNFCPYPLEQPVNIKFLEKEGKETEKTYVFEATPKCRHADTYTCKTLDLYCSGKCARAREKILLMKKGPVKDRYVKAFRIQGGLMNHINDFIDVDEDIPEGDIRRVRWPQIYDILYKTQEKTRSAKVIPLPVGRKEEFTNALHSSPMRNPFESGYELYLKENGQTPLQFSTEELEVAKEIGLMSHDLFENASELPCPEWRDIFRESIEKHVSFEVSSNITDKIFGTAKLQTKYDIALACLGGLIYENDGKLIISSPDAKRSRFIVKGWVPTQYRLQTHAQVKGIESELESRGIEVDEKFISNFSTTHGVLHGIRLSDELDQKYQADEVILSRLHDTVMKEGLSSAVKELKGILSNRSIPSEIKEDLRSVVRLDPDSIEEDVKSRFSI